MLINCPRCGFSQPNDQYCAQCGVNMAAYKPKSVPLFKRFFGNITVQILLLLIAAIFVGQYIVNNQEPQSWIQKITHFQGMSKSKKNQSAGANELSTDDKALTKDKNNINNSVTAQALESLKNNTENNNNNGLQIDTSAPNVNSVAAQGSATIVAQNGTQDLSVMTFKLIYAEVNQEVLTKWIAESSNLGLYQNLTEYSAGIIYDFRKKSEQFRQILKSTDIKLNLGNTNSNLSGTMNEDGSQMIGLIAALEYKSSEGEIIHGNINITKNGAQINDNYPAEFDLPRGSAFFMVGTLKREQFASERIKLVMPPFQIFKSPEFMTRKTEFVIILEPDYK